MSFGSSMCVSCTWVQTRQWLIASGCFFSWAISAFPARKLLTGGISPSESTGASSPLPQIRQVGMGIDMLTLCTPASVPDSASHPQGFQDSAHRRLAKGVALAGQRDLVRPRRDLPGLLPVGLDQVESREPEGADDLAGPLGL